MPEQAGVCPVCGQEFVREYPAGECDGCGRWVCGRCLHREVPDHHYSTCDECLQGMSPYRSVTNLDDEELVRVLGDPKALDRDRAAMLLGDRRVAAAMQPLCTALEDKDKFVRSEAARALGGLGQAEAVPGLLRALRDDHDTVRARAAESLAALGVGEAVEPLVALLDDPSDTAAGGAVRALARLGGEQSAGALMAMIGRRSVGWPRREAIKELPPLAGKGALSVLLAGLEDEDPHLRVAAAKALGKLGEAEAEQALLACLDPASGPELRQEAARALGKLGGPGSGERLAGLQTDPDYRVRQAAAWALKDLGWVPSEEEEAVRLEFNRGSLPEIPGREEAVLAVGLWALGDASEHVRWMAISLLRRLGDERALTALWDVLADQSEMVSQEAATAIAAIDPGRAAKARARRAKVIKARRAENIRRRKRHRPGLKDKPASGPGRLEYWLRPRSKGAARGAGPPGRLARFWSGAGFLAAWLGLWLLGLWGLGTLLAIARHLVPRNLGWLWGTAGFAAGLVWLVAAWLLLRRCWDRLGWSMNR